MFLWSPWCMSCLMGLSWLDYTGLHFESLFWRSVVSLAVSSILLQWEEDREPLLFSLDSVDMGHKRKQNHSTGINLTCNNSQSDTHRVLPNVFIFLGNLDRQPGGKNLPKLCGKSLMKLERSWRNYVLLMSRLLLQ